jgi:hypothetical protein
MDLLSAVLKDTVAWLGCVAKTNKRAFKAVAKHGLEHFITNRSDDYFAACYTTDAALEAFGECGELEIYVAVCCNHQRKSDMNQAEKLIAVYSRKICNALRNAGIEPQWNGKGDHPITISIQTSLELATFDYKSRDLLHKFQLEYIADLTDNGVDDECCVLLVSIVQLLCYIGIDPHYSSSIFERFGKKYDVTEIYQFSKEQLTELIESIRSTPPS